MLSQVSKLSIGMFLDKISLLKSPSRFRERVRIAPPRHLEVCHDISKFDCQAAPLHILQSKFPRILHLSIERDGRGTSPMCGRSTPRETSSSVWLIEGHPVKNNLVCCGISCSPPGGIDPCQLRRFVNLCRSMKPKGLTTRISWRTARYRSGRRPLGCAFPLRWSLSRGTRRSSMTAKWRAGPMWCWLPSRSEKSSRHFWSCHATTRLRRRTSNEGSCIPRSRTDGLFKLWNLLRLSNPIIGEAVRVTPFKCVQDPAISPKATLPFH